LVVLAVLWFLRCSGPSFRTIMTSKTRPVVLDLADPPVDDPTLQPDGAFALECPRYVEAVRSALAIKTGVGFGDVEALDAFRLTGPDNEGRPVFLFVPGNIPEDDRREEIVEKLTLYVISVVHEVVVRQGKGFTAMWLCQNENPSRLSVGWFRRTYYSIPYMYHQKMASLCIVHPPLQVRALLFLLSYVQRHAFWEKVNFADRLEFLDADVPIALVKTLPQSYKDYDKMLDREMYSQASINDMSTLAGMPSMPPMPPMAPIPGMPGVPAANGSSGDAGVGESPNITDYKRNWED